MWLTKWFPYPSTYRFPPLHQPPILGDTRESMVYGFLDFYIRDSTPILSNFVRSRGGSFFMLSSPFKTFRTSLNNCAHLRSPIRTVWASEIIICEHPKIQNISTALELGLLNPCTFQEFPSAWGGFQDIDFPRCTKIPQIDLPNYFKIPPSAMY